VFYNFPRKSGLSSGGTIFLLRLPRPFPFGRPAIIQAIDPIAGTKIIMTSQAHLGRLRMLFSAVREQSMMLNIIKARVIIAAITAQRTMDLFYRATNKAAKERAAA
jgi:hypothetical protein